MKTPLTSQSVGRKPLHKSKIMKKINRAANVQNFTQKTAESCVYFKILITFAKRLKIKELELWLKLKRQS